MLLETVHAKQSNDKCQATSYKIT